jgi:hypothetical protein
VYNNILLLRFTDYYIWLSGCVIIYEQCVARKRRRVHYVSSYMHYDDDKSRPIGTVGCGCPSQVVTRGIHINRICFHVTYVHGAITRLAACDASRLRHVLYVDTHYVGHYCCLDLYNHGLQLHLR